jgi:hypothetical protein
MTDLAEFELHRRIEALEAGRSREELRMRCLELAEHLGEEPEEDDGAHKSTRSLTKQIVDRAEAYFAFVSAGTGQRRGPLRKKARGKRK